MLPKYKAILLSILSVSLICIYTFPSSEDSKIKNSINSNTNTAEIRAESNYITDDATITTTIHLTLLYHELEDTLTSIDNIDIDEIKNAFPEVMNITSTDMMIGNDGSDNFEVQQIPISPIITDGNCRFVFFHIPISYLDQTYIYYVKIKLDVYEDIQKKEELRMFTVTNLQNNRWKTTPTKYNTKKGLHLSLNEKLPDIKPTKDEKGLSHYITDEIIIKFDNEVDEKYIKDFLNKYNLKISKTRDHTIIAKCKDGCSKEILILLEKEESNNPNIEYFEPHFIYLSNETNDNMLFTPNDRLYLDYQWNLPSISTEEGWEKTRGNDDIIIAVVDTGIDLNHPEFENKLVTGYNVLYPNELPIDDDGHGTHVAGIISANTNNDEGIAGITWFNKIMPIKVLDQSGAGTLFDVAEGIYWATDHNAKIINLSLGNYAESEYLHDAVKYAYSKDVILIAAAGNDSISELGYPASYSEVIAVGAVDYNRKLAEFSNFGQYIDVVAPGVNIASTYPKFEYASLSGTSMACPHVTGLAGLLKSANPNLSNEEIINIIKNSAIDLGSTGKDQYYGYGIINIENAISYSEKEINYSKEEIKSEDYISFFEWLKSLFNIG